jgi:hypothetical protein
MAPFDEGEEQRRFHDKQSFTDGTPAFVAQRGLILDDTSLRIVQASEGNTQS